MPICRPYSDGSCGGSFGKIAVRVCRGGGETAAVVVTDAWGGYAPCPIAAIGICASRRKAYQRGEDFLRSPI